LFGEDGGSLLTRIFLPLKIDDICLTRRLFCPVGRQIIRTRWLGGQCSQYVLGSIPLGQGWWSLDKQKKTFQLNMQSI
jgi:hypothetical protein